MTPYLIPVRESRVPGLGMQGLCPQCRGWATIWPHAHPFGAGRLGNHATEKGGYCDGSETAITLDAAIARDSRLNPEEQAAWSAAWRYLNGCRGPLLDDDCWHPICDQRAREGLRWTLMGWRKTDDGALF